MTDPVVSVKDLRITFPTLEGRLTAVDGLSFDVPDGGAVGIVGESGSGKSATSLALMGLHRGTNADVTGDITVAGTSINTASDTRVRAMRGNDIAMVFQDPMSSLHPQYTIGNQLIEALKVHRPGASASDARARAVESLDRVGIPDAAKRINSYPHEFSGGMRQRALIAMGLMCEPTVLLADEITTALDVTVQAQILDLLDDLRNDLGMSLILVSHDLAVVAGSVDEVLVMQNGGVVERGDVRDVLSAPAHPYTRSLLAAVPRVDVSRAQRRAQVRAERLEPASEGQGEQAQRAQRARRRADAEAAEQRTGATAKPEKSDEDAALLSVRNARMRFKVRGGLLGGASDFYAVDDVSFDLHQGETLGIVGESGSGKSTLSRMITRLLTPTSGEIAFEGRDITRLSERKLRPLRRDIQMIFQNPYSSLNPRVTIGDSIGAGLRVQGETDTKQIQRKVQQLLERVGLEASHYNRFPHAFSGGQRQRIAIARALILRPKLVICDEPVSALDVSTQDQVLRLLDELQDDFDLTYIFVAHDLAVVRQVSDRVAVMRQGEIVELDHSDTVYEAPRHDYTRELLTAAPVLDPVEAKRQREQRAERRRASTAA
ncbi:dipeptide ABC transporter ATP-binding protein [Streptomonospora salina]|uniref:Peptide/nickel transport system ATP-binding protein n=1 Tax=Streptomonospora salina TaxID=104205 RepID=A0A841ENY7_9ACTN|nr:ABC transporter ATP-binding protein [Streptomonospora salina]MBB6001131.1 peptide/nickel transport system ATP-binding protein [Streptomonospora salina]